MIDDLVTRIEAAYARKAYSCGWRLLYSPIDVLERKADVAFFGLNPGGARDYPEHPRFAPKDGSAYVTEVWNAKKPAGLDRLQVQVRRLFAGLGVEPASVLAGNFVPFRSRSWMSLPERDFALAFSRKEIWQPIVTDATPKLVIGMGKGILTRELMGLLGITSVDDVPVGWGDVCAQVGSTNRCRLVILPHLSRFSIMARLESQEALKVLFNGRWMPKESFVVERSLS